MRGSFRKKGGKGRGDLPLAYRGPVPADRIRNIIRPHELPIRLVGINRHMERWAVGQGKGLQNADSALLERATMTALGEEEAITTDMVVCRLPEHWRRLAHWWYRSEKSLDQIAKDLATTRDGVLLERKILLGILYGSLTNAGLRIPHYELKA
jgi:hypothetical protein